MRVRINGAVYDCPNISRTQALAAQTAGKLTIVKADTPFVGAITVAKAIAGDATSSPAPGGSSSGSSAKAKFNGCVAQAVAGVKAALERKEMSTVLQIIGDSTGTDLTEWFGVLVQKIAKDNPEYSLLWSKYEASLDTTGGWDQRVLVRQGTGGHVLPGTERGAALTAAQLSYASSSVVNTADLDLRVKVQPIDWVPGGAAAKRTLVARWGNAASRVFTFFIDEAGKLGFEWSANGTATVATVLSSVAVPFAAGTEAPAKATVRCTFQLNNGSSGNTAKFYTSTDDGVTWTQLGTDVVTATEATLSNSVGAFTIGSRAVGSVTDTLDGTFYWTEVLGVSGSNTTGYVPPLPDHWEQTTTAASVVYVGAPVIYAVCSSISGQQISYFDETNRKLRINSPRGQAVVILSTNHNESNVGRTFWTTYSGWITSVKTRQPDVPIVVCSQNPSTYPGSLLSSDRQAKQRWQRAQTLMERAPSVAGVYTLDVGPAFADPATPSDPHNNAYMLTKIESDGVHPTQATWQLSNQVATDTSGSYAWGNFAYTELFL